MGSRARRDRSIQRSPARGVAALHGLHDELLELALSEGDLDEGAAAALLGRMVGHIQYMGLQLRSDPARPTLVNTQYSPWNWGHSNPDTLYLSARIDDAHDYRVYGQTRFGCTDDLRRLYRQG